MLNEEGRFEHLEKGGISPIGMEASELFMEFILGFIPYLTEYPDGIYNVEKVE